LLNLLIAFLSPKIDPSTLDEVSDEGDEGMLPSSAGEEFKPFIRRLPEMKFWQGAQRAVLFAIFATFFQAFNVPVFWPILVLYFFVLFGTFRAVTFVGGGCALAVFNERSRLLIGSHHQELVLGGRAA
jgi:hypothetical protein